MSATVFHFLPNMAFHFSLFSFFFLLRNRLWFPGCKWVSLWLCTQSSTDFHPPELWAALWGFACISRGSGKRPWRYAGSVDGGSAGWPPSALPWIFSVISSPPALPLSRWHSAKTSLIWTISWVEQLEGPYCSRGALWLVTEQRAREMLAVKT